MINTRMKLLRCIVLSAGLLGMSLRGLIYATAIDSKGLLIRNHWATWSILILTGFVLALLLVMTRKPLGPSSYQNCYPGSFWQGATALGAAAAIALEAVPSFLAPGDTLDLVTSLFGLASGGALLVISGCRFTGKRPSFLFHSILCIFFALQMVSQYRHWSSSPQLMNYCFYMIAFICLMLTAYFLAAFEADMDNRRALWFFSMAAAFFCFLALPASSDTGLLIACALWAFFCVPRNQTKVRRRPANEGTEDADT